MQDALFHIPIERSIGAESSLFNISPSATTNNSPPRSHSDYMQMKVLLVLAEKRVRRLTQRLNAVKALQRQEYTKLLARINHIFPPHTLLDGYVPIPVPRERNDGVVVALHTHQARDILSRTLDSLENEFKVKEFDSLIDPLETEFNDMLRVISSTKTKKVTEKKVVNNGARKGQLGRNALNKEETGVDEVNEAHAGLVISGRYCQVSVRPFDELNYEVFKTSEGVHKDMLDAG